MSFVSAGFFDDFFSEKSEDGGTMFEDMGIEGNNCSDWKYLNDLKISVTDKGTVLINNGDSNAFYSANKPSTSMDSFDDLKDWNPSYTVEFDLISDNNSSIQIVEDEDKFTTRTFEQLGVSSNSHVKLVNDGSTVKYYINGLSSPVYTSNITLNQTAVRFVIPPNGNLTYKNFTIY